MSEDLDNEIEAIRAIYDENTIRPTSNKTIYIFSIPPQHDVSVRLHFPTTYPADDPPQTRGVESTGPNTAKGYGSHVLGLVDQVLESVFEPGTVCLFDVVQELQSRLSSGREDGPTSPADDVDDEGVATAAAAAEPTISMTAPPPPPPPSFSPSNSPKWSTSPPLTTLKSTFLARATAVHSPAAVHHALAHLHATDKKTAKATHVMSAYRIRHDGATTYEEDCEDDGEAGAGGRLLQLLRLMGVWDVLVVVVRWYGGVKLGSERFRCVGQVAREAVVRLREGG
ncbi:MAG: hypothetical protein OHK93_004034 [Ramalina farinacea]|uniref:RWD domain-containing protein n=1 Tax=Ramalina farinacea TaxID=258253 RepID=A0AA43QG06_9LECA|nr:hypothetical protein [Ramalina farinacea]